MIEYLCHIVAYAATEIARLCLWLALLTCVLLPLERLFSLHRGKILRDGVFVDLGYYFLNGLLPALLLSAPLGLVAWLTHAIVPPGLHATVAEAPLWARAACAFVLGDLGYYWGHRCLHAVPFLWRFHAIHHSARKIDFLVNTRAHPVDMVFSRLSGLIPLYVFGLASPDEAAGGNAPQPGNELFSAATGDQAAGMVVNAAAAPDGGYDLLAVVQTASAAGDALHLGSLSGPVLQMQALPYAVPSPEAESV